MRTKKQTINPALRVPGNQQQSSAPKRSEDQRFQQLLEVAKRGDECAVGDLFREFGFRFGEEEAP